MWEGNIDCLFLVHARAGIEPAKLGMCPDWGLNLQPFLMYGMTLQTATKARPFDYCNLHLPVSDVRFVNGKLPCCFLLT